MENLKKNILVKLEKAGVIQNNKWLVKDVSLQIEKGKIVTLIGPNGSGKTTTAKIALGIHKNIKGNVKKFTDKIGYVPQKISIDWTLPIRVTDFMQLTHNLENSEIENALSLTGVKHLIKNDLRNLSGGEFQRVLIARAISKKPDLLVLDEPVQGVDFKGEIALYELIKTISEKLNCGILLISHDLHVVIWRRLAFFGDTLAHSALLGVTLAFTFEISIALSVFIISSIIALILLKLQKNTKLPGDALLGLLAHSSLAVGLVVIGFLSFIRFDIMGFLFGDILAVSTSDLITIWVGGALILFVLNKIWKPLFASTVNYDLAEAEGMSPEKANAIFTVLLAAIIAISIKMVGLLLITGMFIMPAAMARNLSNNPRQMVIISIIGGLLSVLIGLFSSLEFNTASGPSIITAALFLFILSLIKFKKNSELKQ